MHFDQNINSTNRIYFSDINSMIYEQKMKYERTSPLYMIPFTGHMTAAVPAPNDSSNCVLCCVADSKSDWQEGIYREGKGEIE